MNFRARWPLSVIRTGSLCTSGPAPHLRETSACVGLTEARSMDWKRYMRDNSNDPIWAPVAVDYYLSIQEKESLDDYLNWLVDKICVNSSDLYATHKRLLMVCVSLAGAD